MRLTLIPLLALVLAGCDEEQAAPATPAPAPAPAPEPDPEPTPPPPDPEPEPEPEPLKTEWRSPVVDPTGRPAATLVATCDPFALEVHFESDPGLFATSSGDGVAGAEAPYRTGNYVGSWSFVWDEDDPTKLRLAKTGPAQPGFITDTEIAQLAISGHASLSLTFSNDRPSVVADPCLREVCVVNGSSSGFGANDVRGFLFEPLSPGAACPHNWEKRFVSRTAPYHACPTDDPPSSATGGCRNPGTQSEHTIDTWRVITPPADVCGPAEFETVFGQTAEYQFDLTGAAEACRAE